jgi:redox-sensitive bicupin YhaK (pirin superfamily)
MPEKAILDVRPLDFPWPGADPFLFCVYHEDKFPAGNAALGPVASLEGRNLGQDFDNIQGWNMYHGETVPGFPQHPHRGFETVTVVRQGLIDHADSLGASARYGQGDTQWLTTGSGISHSEMFPLLNQDKGNPAELFQIWLNLAPGQKMAAPHFKMLWAPLIPKFRAQGLEATLIAGSLGDLRPPTPPPDSWASQPGSDLAIWMLKLGPHAAWTLPAASPGLNRALYFFKGQSLRAAGSEIQVRHRLMLKSDAALKIENGPEASELLMLQGRPIGAPVVNSGPFVMNTRQELMQAFEDYQASRFGGWPWPVADPVHAADAGRFAKHPDGSTEKP